MLDNERKIGRAPSGERLWNKPFAFACFVLVAAALLAWPVAEWMEIRQYKKAIPLKAPLDELKASELAPYRVIDRAVLAPAILEALGTDRYLHWTLEDTSLPANDPLRIANLFVTFYTGGINLVPHTPDVCYLGSGYEAARPHENMEADMPTLGAAHQHVPFRVCTFAKSAVFDRREFTVVYTFFANSRFAATRNRVRVLVNDLHHAHAFFSKVEVGFPGAGREQSVVGARRLFEKVLPVLLRDHWPDPEQAAADGQSQVNRAG